MHQFADQPLEVHGWLGIADRAPGAEGGGRGACGVSSMYTFSDRPLRLS